MEWLAENAWLGWLGVALVLGAIETSRFVGDDGRIYGIPNNSSSVIRIDPRTQAVDTIGHCRTGRHRTDGKYKYLGGVKAANGNLCECSSLPSRAQKHVLVFTFPRSARRLHPI